MSEREQLGWIGRWLERVRLRYWWHFLALPLVAVPRDLDTGSTLALLRGVAITFLVLAFGYLHNAMTDRGMDQDLEKNPLTRGAPPPAWAPLIPAGLALALAVTGPASARLGTALTLLSGYVYSGGPRLKRFPGIGSLLNLTHFVPLLWVGQSGEAGERPLLGFGLVLSGMLLQSQLIHEAQDAAEDAAGGVMTSFLWLGPRVTALIAALAGLAVVAWARAHFTAPAPLLAPAALLFVVTVPLRLLRRAQDARAMKQLRAAQRWSSMALGLALLLTAP